MPSPSIFSPHADKLFIGGSWVDSSIDGAFTLVDPNSEEKTGTVAEAGAADMDRAVAAARQAFAGSLGFGQPLAQSLGAGLFQLALQLQ